jgi:hypothetical protein
VLIIHRQERADYGHFFYRIPNGESAADAYDRVAMFNESLWRQFGEKDFPSVCVLVTHGLMTRVFLMKWYHWSVEYFEDLRNINHCEFITMRQNMDTGKYILETELRTWSELKRQRAEEERERERDPQRRNTLSHFLTKEQESPNIPPRKWGGCVGGCNHGHGRFPRRKGLEKSADVTLPPAATAGLHTDGQTEASVEKAATLGSTTHPPSSDGTADPASNPTLPRLPIRTTVSYLQHGRDGGGSGANTPHEMSSDDDGEYFATATAAAGKRPRTGAMASVTKNPQRKATPQDIERWANESGMGRGVKADGLGDEPSLADAEGEGDVDAIGKGSGRDGEAIDPEAPDGGDGCKWIGRRKCSSHGPRPEEQPELTNLVRAEKETRRADAEGGHMPGSGIEEVDKWDRSLRGSVY